MLWFIGCVGVLVLLSYLSRKDKRYMYDKYKD